MNHMRATYCKCELFIGSREGYDGRTFSQEQLEVAIGDFQDVYKELHGDTVSLCVSPVRYIVGKYRENGWCLSAINYPRFPKEFDDIAEFFLELQEFLIHNFKQNRITITMDGPISGHDRSRQIDMATAPWAEDAPQNVSKPKT